jgi:hypothetical protein
LVTKLIAAFLQGNTNNFRRVGGFIFEFLRFDLFDDELEIQIWMKNKVSNLQKSEVLAIEAAIAVTVAAYQNKAEMVDNFVPVLMALMEKLDASAYVASWALLWLGDGLTEDAVWVPQTNELMYLARYLNRAYAYANAA